MTIIFPKMAGWSPGGAQIGESSVKTLYVQIPIAKNHTFFITNFRKLFFYFSKI